DGRRAPPALGPLLDLGQGQALGLADGAQALADRGGVPLVAWTFLVTASGLRFPHFIGHRPILSEWRPLGARSSSLRLASSPTRGVRTGASDPTSGTGNLRSPAGHRAPLDRTGRPPPVPCPPDGHREA